MNRCSQCGHQMLSKWTSQSSSDIEMTWKYGSCIEFNDIFMKLLEKAVVQTLIVNDLNRISFNSWNDKLLWKENIVTQCRMTFQLQTAISFCGAIAKWAGIDPIQSFGPNNKRRSHCQCEKWFGFVELWAFNSYLFLSSRNRNRKFSWWLR